MYSTFSRPFRSMFASCTAIWSSDCNVITSFSLIWQPSQPCTRVHREQCLPWGKVTQVSDRSEYHSFDKNRALPKRSKKCEKSIHGENYNGPCTGEYIRNFLTNQHLESYYWDNWFFPLSANNSNVISLTWNSLKYCVVVVVVVL